MDRCENLTSIDGLVYQPGVLTTLPLGWVLRQYLNTVTYLQSH